MGSSSRPEDFLSLPRFKANGSLEGQGGIMDLIALTMRGLVKFKSGHKLESRLLGEISITSDMQMTPPFWQKVKN